MTTDEALGFLRRHQPMPDDDQLSEELIGEYEAVRLYFVEHPDPRCIPLFLGSFGCLDGLGVYQMVEEVLRSFPSEVIVPHLQGALEAPRHSVRYWATEIASGFPDPTLVESLAHRLEQDDKDTRYFAALALGLISDPRVQEILRTAQDVESDPDVRAIIDDILHGRL